MQAAKGLAMEKWLCWVSMGVAGVLLILFSLDPFLNVFGGFIVVDVFAILACLLLFYLGWSAFRDLR